MFQIKRGTAAAGASSDGERASLVAMLVTRGGTGAAWALADGERERAPQALAAARCRRDHRHAYPPQLTKSCKCIYAFCIRVYICVVFSTSVRCARRRRRVTWLCGSHPPRSLPPSPILARTPSTTATTLPHPPPSFTTATSTCPRSPLCPCEVHHSSESASRFPLRREGESEKRRRWRPVYPPVHPLHPTGHIMAA